MKKIAALLLLVAATAHGEESPHRFTLNYQQGEIKDILRAISLAEGANIITDRDVEGPITVYLKDVTLEGALEAITTPNGFTWDRENDIYRVRKIRENPYVRVRNGKVTIHADNIAIGPFIDAASRATGLNLSLTEPIQMNITTHLTDLPLEDGILQALRVNGLAVTKEGSVFRISPARAPVKIERREDGKIVVDAQSADIRAVFTSLARLTGENIILDADVQVPSVTFYVTQAEFTDVLSALTATYGLAWQKLGNLYRIYRPQAGVQLPVDIQEVEGIQRVSFDLRGADLGEIVRQMATRLGWNSVFYVAAQEKVSLRVDRMPVTDALDLLFTNTPHAWVLDTTTSPAPTFLVGNPAAGSREASRFLTEADYPVVYLRAGDLVPFFPSDVPATNYKILVDPNVIRLSGTPRMHRALAQFLARTDSEPRQIEVSLLVMEINRDRASALGMGNFSIVGDQWSGTFSPSGSPTISYTISRGASSRIQSVTSSVTALERQGVVRVRVSPYAVVRNGLSASFGVTRTDNIVILTPTNNPGVAGTDLRQVPSGTTINVTPFTASEGKVIDLTVTASVSSASGQVSATQLPTVSGRNATTRVTIANGRTARIGGLIQTRENEAQDRVPVIGRLPLLRWIFGNESWSSSTTELVFFIRPRVVGIQGEPDGVTFPGEDTGAVTPSWEWQS